MVSKLPAFQFYPGDWRKDPGVQSLSYHDRGVWFEMLLLMHESPVRGKLMLGQGAISDEILASILHMDLETLQATISTLVSRGVTERDSRTGALVNRRMLRDENIRSENRKRLHNWRKTHKTKENGNENEMEMKRLPSSSSSSSSSSSTSVSNKKQIQEQKPSPKPRKRDSGESKHSSDPRHVACKEEIFAYYRLKNGDEDPDWNGREGRALGMLLSANPKLTADGMRKLLTHRTTSEVNHSERPALWLGNIKSYLNGPIDRFGKPLNGGNGNGQFASRNSTKGDRNFNTGIAVIQQIENRARAHNDGAGSTGGVGDSRTGTGSGKIVEGKL